MAIYSPEEYASWRNIDAAKVPDFSPVLLAALNFEDDLIKRVSIGPDTGQRKIQSLAKDLNSFRVTNTVALNATDPTMVLTDADAKMVQVGSMLFNTAVGKFECLFATAKTDNNDGTFNITVTRDYGTVLGAGDTHLDNAVFRVIHSEQEGSNQGEDMTRDKTALYNITQIYPTTVKMTRNTLYADWRNVPDVFAESVADRALEVRKMMAEALIWGVRAPGDPSASQHATMGGLMWWIRKTAGSNYFSTPATWDYNVASALIDSTADRGVQGQKLVLAVGPALYKVASVWAQDRQRSEYGTGKQTVGTITGQIMSAEGIFADLVLERNMPEGAAMVVDLNRLWLRAFKNSKWLAYVTELGTNGVDAKSIRMLAEWTLDIRNPAEAFALQVGLT